MARTRMALAALALSLLGAASGAAQAQGAEALRALFAKYSPDASHVVEYYASNAKEWGWTSVAALLDGSSEDARWLSYARVVHDAAMTMMEASRPEGSTLVILSKDKKYPVPWTSVMYSIAIVDSVPERMRLPHFKVLSDQPSNLPLGHWAGVYGLTDEMAAHYLAAKALWELLPSLQAQGAKAPWGSYLQALNESIAAILEFKYYALKYILVQERESPDQYRGIVGNKGFATAFLALDGACSAFINRYFQAKDEVYETIRGLGLIVHEEGPVLVVGSRGAEARKELGSSLYATAANELSKPDFRELEARLNGGTDVAVSPPFPGMRLVASGSAPPVKQVLSEAEALKLGGLNIGFRRREAVVATQQMRALRMGLGGGRAPAAAAPSSGAVSAAAVVEDIRAGRPSAKARVALRQKGRVGNVPVKSVDLAGGEVRIFPDFLLCALSFASFDGKLDLNQEGTEEEGIEYACALKLDLAGDGTERYALALTWFKDADGPFTGLVTAICPAGLWKETDQVFEPVEGKVTAYLSGSYLVLVLADGGDLALKRIGPKTRFWAETLYMADGQAVEDRLDF